MGETLAPHVQRLVDEQTQLLDRIDKLHRFMTGIVFSNLDPVDQALLRAQLGLMSAYNELLDTRRVRALSA